MLSRSPSTAPTAFAALLAFRAGMVCRTLAVLLVGALWGGTIPAVAAVAEGSLSFQTSLGALAPGADIPVTWSPLPTNADEVELLVECRSPAVATLRLTESLGADQAGYVWRVPNLPCDEARLRLRAGIDQREVVWASSAPFRIAWEKDAPFPRLARRDGELWLAEPADDGAGAWDAAAPDIGAGAPGDGRDVDLTSPPRGIQSESTCSEIGRDRDPTATPAPRGRRLAARSPRRLQLRI